MEYFFINAIFWSLIKSLFPFFKKDMHHLPLYFLSWSNSDIGKYKFIMLRKNYDQRIFLKIHIVRKKTICFQYH